MNNRTGKDAPYQPGMAHEPTLAKLSMPRLAQGVARPRLFETLDRALNGGAAWLVAPGGAGKTTVAATYIAERQLPYLWYKLDSDDADPATFFYYLGLAAKTAAKDPSLRMPLLTPEYLPDIPGFARRYFRDLFSALPHGTAILLDNQHEVGDTSVLEIILRSAIDETPAGSGLIILSRVNPPPCLVRHKVGGLMEIIDWEAMRLTWEETRAIAASAGVEDPTASKVLHQRCEGWAAGLTLLLEHAKLGGLGDKVISLGALESIFDYFASELFDHLQASTRDFLLKTALLPHMTASMAEEVSGNPGSGEILADLYHRHFFTNRWDTPEFNYQYHALFREFLLVKAEQAYPHSEYLELVDRAGRVLRKHEQDQEAVPLYLRARQWETAASIILSQAPSLLVHGRGQTVVGWIQQIPEEHITSNPWVLYWYGIGLQFTDSCKAKEMLEGAYDAFSGVDPIGKLLATSAIIDIIYHLRESLMGAVPWVDSLKDQLQKNPDYLSPEIEARVLSSLVSMLELMRPADPALPQYVERLVSLLVGRLEINENEKLQMAGRLVIYYAVVCSDAQACDRLLRYARSLQGTQDITEPSRLLYTILSVLPSLFADNGSGIIREPADALLAMIKDGNMKEKFEDKSLSVLELPASYYAIFLCLQSGNAEAARSLLCHMETLVVVPESIDMALLTMARCMCAFAQGDWASVDTHGQESLQIHRRMGAAISGLELYCIMAIQRCECEKPEDALEYLEQPREQGCRNSPRMRYQVLMIEAYVCVLKRDLEQCHTRLREALTIGRDHGYWTKVFWLMKIAPRLCAEALRAGIEVKHVQRLIGELNIPSDDPSIENWPWPVRIYTLGHFGLVIDGRHFDVKNQRQKKPLILLKLLVAMGGSGVKKEKLADMMWPDADADTALYAFGSNLARLRKIIGEKSVLLKGGRVSLNESVCWWDVQALESCLDVADKGGPCPEESSAFTEKVMGLYKGPFLPHEEDMWFEPLRDRLRSRFSQFVAMSCTSLNDADRKGDARAMLQRAMEADPDCKDLVVSLMINN